jgi:heme iron utilization protein
MSHEGEPPKDSTDSGQGAATASGNAREIARSADAKLVRRLIRNAWKGTLSTLERDGGHPYASLVAIATAADGTPLLLLSGLAEHTKNIAVDSRASILFDGTASGRAALTGPRVTVVGRIFEAPSQSARPRYLARHPDASQFIDFADFRLLALEVEWAHLVAGFGRIVRLGRSDVIIPAGDAGEVIAAEPGVLQHMNQDHRDGIALMAAMAEAAGALPTPARSGATWTMTGCDPEGIDLTDGAAAVRIEFPHCVTSIEQVRSVLISLVDQAREFARDNGN